MFYTPRDFFSVKPFLPPFFSSCVTFLPFFRKMERFRLLYKEGIFPWKKTFLLGVNLPSPHSSQFTLLFPSTGGQGCFSGPPPPPLFSSIQSPPSSFLFYEYSSFFFNARFFAKRGVSFSGLSFYDMTPMRRVSLQKEPLSWGDFPWRYLFVHPTMAVDSPFFSKGGPPSP